MMYAHLFEADGKIYAWYRYPFKFQNAGEEKLLEDKILTTLFEETGDLILLDKQIAEWKQTHGIENIHGFEDFSGMSFPDSDELISMLRQEAYRTAAYLEQERKEKAELQEKYNYVLKLASKRIFEYQTIVELLESEVALRQEIIDAAEEAGFEPQFNEADLAKHKITYH